MPRRQPSYAELESARAELAELREMWGPEQAEKAVALLQTGGSQTFIHGVVQTVRENESRALYDPLRNLYLRFHADGPRSDPAAIVRSEILRWMRGRATSDDVELFEDAIQHYEPTGANGSLAELRGAGLVALDSVSAELAVLYASRIGSWTPVPGDPDLASGEPVLTAVKVMAANGQTPYLLLLLERGGGYPTAEAEALRSLTDVDLKYISHLVAEALRSGDPQLTAAYDLLLSHEDVHSAAGMLGSALDDCKEADSYAYLAMSMVAGREPELLAAFHAQAALEQRTTFVRGAVEALEFDSSAEGRELAERLRKRLSSAR